MNDEESMLIDDPRPVPDRRRTRQWLHETYGQRTRMERGEPSRTSWQELLLATITILTIILGLHWLHIDVNGIDTLFRTHWDLPAYLFMLWMLLIAILVQEWIKKWMRRR